MARLGRARHGGAGQGMGSTTTAVMVAGPVRLRPTARKARLGLAWLGEARRGEAGQGTARQGRGSTTTAVLAGTWVRAPRPHAWRGEARRGGAWHGLAGLGTARQGRAGQGHYKQRSNNGWIQTSRQQSKMARTIRLRHHTNTRRNHHIQRLHRHHRIRPIHTRNIKKPNLQSQQRTTHNQIKNTHLCPRRRLQNSPRIRTRNTSANPPNRR